MGRVERNKLNDRYGLVWSSNVCLNLGTFVIHVQNSIIYINDRDVKTNKIMERKYLWLLMTVKDNFKTALKVKANIVSRFGAFNGL